MLGLLTLFACADDGSGGSADSLRIRIHNTSSSDIANFWLGSGQVSASHEYGPISAGATTDYAALPLRVSAYSKYNFLTPDNTRYITSVYPAQSLDISELIPGAYTFEITVDPATATSTVTVLQD